MIRFLTTELEKESNKNVESLRKYEETGLYHQPCVI